MRGLVVSLLIHAGFIAAGVIYLPRAAQLLETTPYVPIELVTLAETTNVTAAAPDPEPEPEPEEVPVEPEAEEAPTVEDEIVDPTPAPEPEPEVAPEPEVITPDPVEEDAPAREPEVVEPEPVREEPRRPDPEPEPEPADPFDFLNDLAATVDEARDERASEDGDRRRAVGNGTENTATLQVILQNHLARCWRNSLDAPHPDELAVEVELSLNRNGELMGPPRLVDQGRVLNSSNPYLRVAGERALRAASVCAPYPLPPEQYSEWRQITANFAPSLYGN